MRVTKSGQTPRCCRASVVARPAVQRFRDGIRALGLDEEEMLCPRIESEVDRVD